MTSEVADDIKVIGRPRIAPGSAGPVAVVRLSQLGSMR